MQQQLLLSNWRHISTDQVIEVQLDFGGAPISVDTKNSATQSAQTLLIHCVNTCASVLLLFFGNYDEKNEKSEKKEKK